MNTYDKNQKCNGFIAFLIFIVTLLIAGEFSRHGIDYHHDGIMFKPALDISNGMTPFKESFIQYGLFSTLVQSASINLIGPYLISLKLLTAFFYALIAVSLWYIWRTIMPTWLALISIVIWLTLSPSLVSNTFPWSTVFALFFIFTSVLLIIYFISSTRYQLLFWAGCSSSLVFWCRQPTGFAVTAGFILYLALLTSSKKGKLTSYMKSLGLFILGHVLITSIFISYIIVSNIFDDFWRQSILFSFLFNENFGPKSLFQALTIFFPYPFNTWNGGYIWDIFPLITLVIFFLTGFNIFFRKINTPQNQTLLLITFSGLITWHLYYPFPDFMKAFWGASLMIGFLPYALWRILSSLPRPLATPVLLLLLASILFRDYSTRVPAIINFYTSTNIPAKNIPVLRGMKLDQNQSLYINTLHSTISEYLAQHPSRPFINVTTDGLFATLTERNQNFHPAYVKWGLLQYRLFPDYQQALLNFVNLQRPLALVYLPPNIDSVGIRDGVPFIFNGEETFNNYKILQKFESGATLIAPID